MGNTLLSLKKDSEGKISPLEHSAKKIYNKRIINLSFYNQTKTHNTTLKRWKQELQYSDIVATISNGTLKVINISIG